MGHNFGEFSASIVTVILYVFCKVYMWLGVMAISDVSGTLSIIVGLYTIFVGFPKFKERIIILYKRYFKKD